MKTTRLYRLGYSLRYSGMFGVAISLAEMTSRGVTATLVVPILLSIPTTVIGWIIARREAKLHGFQDIGWAPRSNTPTESVTSSGLIWWAAMLGFGIFTTISNVVDWIANGTDWFSLTLTAIEATIGLVGLVFILRENDTSNKVNPGGATTSERQ